MSRNQAEPGAASTHSKPKSNPIQADWPLNLDFLPQNHGSSDGRDNIIISNQWFLNWYLERATEHNKLRQLLIESHSVLISSMTQKDGNLPPKKKVELESRIKELVDEKNHYYRRIQELEKIMTEQEKSLMKKIDALENKNEILEAKLADLLSGAKFYDDERKQWVDSNAGRAARMSPTQPARAPLQPVERPVSRSIRVAPQPAEHPGPIGIPIQLAERPLGRPAIVSSPEPAQTRPIRAYMPPGRRVAVQTVKPIAISVQPTESPLIGSIGVPVPPQPTEGPLISPIGVPVPSQPNEPTRTRSIGISPSPAGRGRPLNSTTEAIQDGWLRKPEPSPTPSPGRKPDPSSPTPSPARMSSPTASPGRSFTKFAPPQVRTRVQSASFQTPQTEEHKRPEPAKPEVVRMNVHIYHGEECPADIDRWIQAIENEVARNEVTNPRESHRKIDDKYIEIARLHMDGVSVYPWFTRMCLSSGVKDLRRPVIEYPFSWVAFQVALRGRFEDKGDD